MFFIVWCQCPGHHHAKPKSRKVGDVGDVQAVGDQGQRHHDDEHEHQELDGRFRQTHTKLLAVRALLPDETEERGYHTGNSDARAGERKLQGVAHEAGNNRKHDESGRAIDLFEECAELPQPVHVEDKVKQIAVQQDRRHERPVAARIDEVRGVGELHQWIQDRLLRSNPERDREADADNGNCGGCFTYPAYWQLGDSFFRVPGSTGTLPSARPTSSPRTWGYARL